MVEVAGHVDVERVRAAFRSYLGGRAWQPAGAFHRLLFTELWARRFLGPGPLEEGA